MRVSYAQLTQQIYQRRHNHLRLNSNHLIRQIHVHGKLHIGHINTFAKTTNRNHMLMQKVE